MENYFIIAKNKIYELLETAEIGTVIKKMRDGVLNANGIRNTCTLHRFLFENTKLANPFNAFQKINPNKVYFFQLNARLDGCNSRINETGIFSIILAFVYQVYIYFLNENEEVLNNFITELEDVAVAEKKPILEGKNMFIILAKKA